MPLIAICAQVIPGCSGSRNPDLPPRYLRSTTTYRVCRSIVPRELAASNQASIEIGRLRGRLASFAIARCITSPWPNCLPEQICEVLRCWQDGVSRARGRGAEVNHILIFENKGKVVGVLIPHPQFAR